jgi:hypothetical protein
MWLRPWVFRLSILAVLVLGSALCAGWKWDSVPH